MALAAACLRSVRDGRGPDTGKPRANVGAFLCLVHPDGGSRLMWNARYASIEAVAGEGGGEECDAGVLDREFLAQGKLHADVFMAILAVHQVVDRWGVVLILHLQAGACRTTQCGLSFPLHVSSPSQQLTESGEVQRSGLFP